MSVVVLGPEAADAIFGRHDGIVGETIRIEGQPFRVIGVLVAKGGGAFGSEDDSAYIPFTTAQARLIKRGSRDEVDVLYVQATTAESVPQASDEISNILRQRHRTPIGDDDFTVFTQQDFLQTFETITGVLTIFLGGIAGISLLVGGIGIMNIMLVSVTERTREIGLRKALGARKKDILLQFLTESSLLSLIGGIIGIMFGWLIAFAVGQVATATGNNFMPSRWYRCDPAFNKFLGDHWPVLWDLSCQPCREFGASGSLALRVGMLNDQSISAISKDILSFLLFVVLTQGCVRARLDAPPACPLLKILNQLQQKRSLNRFQHRQHRSRKPQVLLQRRFSQQKLLLPKVTISAVKGNLYIRRGPGHAL